MKAGKQSDEAADRLADDMFALIEQNFMPIEDHREEIVNAALQVLAVALESLRPERRADVAARLASHMPALARAAGLHDADPQATRH